MYIYQYKLRLCISECFVVHHWLSNMPKLLKIVKWNYSVPGDDNDDKNRRQCEMDQSDAKRDKYLYRYIFSIQRI